jgi:hypothetical protein
MSEGSAPKALVISHAIELEGGYGIYDGGVYKSDPTSSWTPVFC